MSGEDDGTIPFKRLGAKTMASMTDIEREAAVVELLKAENELRQLRSENKWLREANKSLSEALDKALKLLPDGALV